MSAPQAAGARVRLDDRQPTEAEARVMAALLDARRERRGAVAVPRALWDDVDGPGRDALAFASRLLGVALASRWRPGVAAADTSPNGGTA